ncbi:MAG: NAD-dependent epimerase/dehydratase family protein, partial [Candidatus Thorarchaeota archaeon]
MKVLVTGATGFIGRRVATALVEAGHEVTAFVRNTSNVSGLPDRASVLEGDMLDRDSLQRAVIGQDAVAHFAAYFDFYATDVELLYRINVEGTRDLMKACADASVQRFLYCSTTEVIGPVRCPPGNEDTELCPQWDYAKSKNMAEETIREISKSRGLDHIILRASGVVGEGDLY